MTLRWDQTAPPREYLEDAFDDHPVNWKADVYVDGKKAGSGDGSLEVKLVKGSKHKVRIVPTPAAADDNFYLSVTREAHGQGRHGRRRARLQPLEPAVHRRQLGARGIDPAKAADMTTATDARKSVQVNKQVLPTVKKTNDYFASNKLTGRRAGGGDGLDACRWAATTAARRRKGAFSNPLDRVRDRHERR